MVKKVFNYNKINRLTLECLFKYKYRTFIWKIIQKMEVLTL